MQQRRWWVKGCASLLCASLGACSVFGSHPLRAEATLRPVGRAAAHGDVALTERGEAVQVTYNIAGLRPGTAHTFAIHAGGSCDGPDARDAGARLITRNGLPVAAPLAAATSPDTAMSAPGAAAAATAAAAPAASARRLRASSGGSAFGMSDASGVATAGAAPRDRAGDQLTRIWADGNGVAMGFFVLPGLKLDGVRSVVGRSMVIHAGADEWDDPRDNLPAATPGAAPVGQAGVDPAGAALACGVIER